MKIALNVFHKCEKNCNHKKELKSNWNSISDRWKVQTHKFKDVEGIVGFAPSCYLELLDENAPAHCLESSEQDSGDTGFSAQQAEKKRK